MLKKQISLLKSIKQPLENIIYKQKSSSIFRKSSVINHLASRADDSSYSLSNCTKKDDIYDISQFQISFDQSISVEQLTNEIKDSVGVEIVKLDLSNGKVDWIKQKILNNSAKLQNYIRRCDCLETSYLVIKQQIEKLNTGASFCLSSSQSFFYCYDEDEF
ncbi:Hypothetical_protein [Hexamita inflata]|uniref:Hypothetical_protein n=1 Tax=Hexamita inflata TaxID=28002 RepID=A0AA86PPF2_9EUKA|nr:Hypothetical protein HINF_LOCUS26214 [Hexamita inflata]